MVLNRYLCKIQPAIRHASTHAHLSIQGIRRWEQTNDSRRPRQQRQIAKGLRCSAQESFPPRQLLGLYTRYIQGSIGSNSRSGPREPAHETFLVIGLPHLSSGMQACHYHATCIRALQDKPDNCTMHATDLDDVVLEVRGELRVKPPLEG